MPATTSRARLWVDRTARNLVTAGGLGVIAAILGIFVFLLAVVLPLFTATEVGEGRRFTVEGPPLRGVVTDAYRTHVAVLDAAATVRTLEVGRPQEVGTGAAAATELSRRDLIAAAPPNPRTASERPVDFAMLPGISYDPSRPVVHLLSVLTDGGRALVQPVRTAVPDDGRRGVEVLELGDLTVLDFTRGGGRVRCWSASVSRSGVVNGAAQLDDGSLVLDVADFSENLFTGEVEVERRRHVVPVPVELVELVLDRELGRLYGRTATGRLVTWRFRGTRLGEPQFARVSGSPATRIGLLFGDQSLLVGHENGEVSIWFPARRDGDEMLLTEVRRLPSMDAPITGFAISVRNKSFLAMTADDRVGLYHSTGATLSHRESAPAELAAAFLSPKYDALWVAGGQQVVERTLHDPHPEATSRSMFGKVWYEGYEEPAYVWQSSSGSDESEPKLSFVPLIVGTLKGTIFSMLLSVPLAVLGAMFVSQFMSPALRAYVKPLIELMAAMPSVVLGFLAAVWLAPRVESFFTGLVLMGVVLPVLVVAVGAVMRLALPVHIRKSVPAGIDGILFGFVLIAGSWLCFELSPVAESTLFGGDLPTWVREVLGLPYEQRNAIVIALAMSFAVVPIIFSISEDAFSNVPRILVSGSLALGADRWQTVTRIVLPSASPGIFSATMVGFGRAVGETMIVLMATGNTPIMSMNPFTGFRTLSANIAVEIPEAPVGGTLYRSLFLAALLLFAFTFVVNTVAEVVRQRLRKRYANL